MGMQKTIKLNVGTSEELWPYQVVDVIEQVMEEGEVNHAHGSWEDEPWIYHMNCASLHIQAYHEGDRSEDHLAHAFTRLMMAVAIKGDYGQSEFDAMVAERDKKVRG